MECFKILKSVNVHIILSFKVGSPTVDKAISKNRISENHNIYSIFRLRGSLVLKLCVFIVLMSTLKPANMSF